MNEDRYQAPLSNSSVCDSSSQSSDDNTSPGSDSSDVATHGASVADFVKIMAVCHTVFPYISLGETHTLSSEPPQEMLYKREQFVNTPPSYPKLPHNDDAGTSRFSVFTSNGATGCGSTIYDHSQSSSPAHQELNIDQHCTPLSQQFVTSPSIDALPYNLILNPHGDHHNNSTTGTTIPARVCNTNSTGTNSDNSSTPDGSTDDIVNLHADAVSAPWEILTVSPTVQTHPADSVGNNNGSSPVNSASSAVALFDSSASTYVLPGATSSNSPPVSTGIYSIILPEETLVISHV
eukprot:Lankesteria_metandrocarpae@DN7211_c0_g1_i1.p1